MKFVQGLMPLSFCMACYVGSLSADVVGDVVPTTKEAQARDEAVLRDYLKSKRPVGVREKGGNLTISGDLRPEWDHYHTVINGRTQRGWESYHRAPNNALPSRKEDLEKYRTAKKDAKTDKARRKAKNDYRKSRDAWKAPYPTNTFAVEANLLFDYVADRGWGTIQLRFDNPAGVKIVDRNSLHDSRKIMYGSGRSDKIQLRTAMAGYNIWQEDLARLDVEVGRKKMYAIFDSKVEFDNFFDGIYARYTNSFTDIADVALRAGAFVIDSTANHYGYIGEASAFNIYNSNIDLKYSLVDWEKKGRNEWGLKHPMGSRFLVSQVLMYYKMPDLFGQKTSFYGAYLVNSAAKPTHWTRGKRANEGYYVGMHMNDIRKKGDWAFEVWYVWMQAQTIPGSDQQDPKRDNPRDITFYDRRSGGAGNCKGFQFEGFYALTDNWTIHPTVSYMRQLSKTIGGTYRGSKVSLETVFAF